MGVLAHSWLPIPLREFQCHAVIFVCINAILCCEDNINSIFDCHPVILFIFIGLTWLFAFHLMATCILKTTYP